MGMHSAVWATSSIHAPNDAVAWWDERSSGGGSGFTAVVVDADAEEGEMGESNGDGNDEDVVVEEDEEV